MILHVGTHNMYICMYVLLHVDSELYLLSFNCNAVQLKSIAPRTCIQNKRGTIHLGTVTYKHEPFTSAALKKKFLSRH